MPKYLSISIRIKSTIKKIKNAATLLLLVSLLFSTQVTSQTPVVSKAVAFAISSPVSNFGIAKPEPGKTTSRKLIGDKEGINTSNEKLIKQVIPGLGGKTGDQIQSTVNNGTNLVSAPIPVLMVIAALITKPHMEAGFIRQTITEMLAQITMFKQQTCWWVSLIKLPGPWLYQNLK